jgi:thymidylate synthase (FAD)
MQIAKPYAKILNPCDAYTTLDNMFAVMVKHCEYAARVSHRSEDAIKEDSAERLLRFIVMNKGDFSVIEHASFSVEFLVDRGITHEIVRHRLFSYTQESTRFVNYVKKMPPSFIEPPINDPTLLSIWKEAIENIEIAYKTLIDFKVSPQLARSVFPNALASKIVMTGNLRNWRHFLLMRTTVEAHPQIREVTIPLLQELQGIKSISWLFEDITPESTQANNMKLMR